MSNNLIADLEEFTKEMAKHDERQAIKSEPEIPTPEILNLRVSLIEEEVDETIQAMYVLESYYKDINNPNRAESIKEAFAEVADGIADSIVVLIGTALAYGIPLQKVWDEVHRSNMDKVTKIVSGLCPDCKGNRALPCVTCDNTYKHIWREPITPSKRSDGKILKPEGWRPPDIKSIIEEAMK
jgi:predicted HAD superfamily Cof-like phosphohydrolase